METLSLCLLIILVIIFVVCIFSKRCVRDSENFAVPIVLPPLQPPIQSDSRCTILCGNNQKCNEMCQKNIDDCNTTGYTNLTNACISAWAAGLNAKCPSYCNNTTNLDNISCEKVCNNISVKYILPFLSNL